MIINTTLVGTINAGGFVGVCYGIVTKNESERSKAFTTITTKTNTGNVNVGGFVGYFDGATISYSDADAVMTGVSGQQVGGLPLGLQLKLVQQITVLPKRLFQVAATTPEAS